jgi:anti-anti-sigma regulatory factor
MAYVNIEKLGELRVVECDGRIVRSEAAFALRDGVTSQSDARVIVLDLSEVHAIEVGGLGMLTFLHRWAQDHRIRLKLFNPRIAVRARLEHSAVATFDIVTLEELQSLLGQAERGYPLRA